jgi:hypothetical protein
LIHYCGAAGVRPDGNASFTGLRYDRTMSQRQTDRFQVEDLALQTVLAGQAMACAYSSSDEFEAAVIRSRVNAGAFGVPKRRRRVKAVFAVVAIAVVIAILLIL